MKNTFMGGVSSVIVNLAVSCQRQSEGFKSSQQKVVKLRLGYFLVSSWRLALFMPQGESANIYVIYYCCHYIDWFLRRHAQFSESYLNCTVCAAWGKKRQGLSLISLRMTRTRSTSLRSWPPLRVGNTTPTARGTKHCGCCRVGQQVEWSVVQSDSRSISKRTKRAPLCLSTRIYVLPMVGCKENWNLRWDWGYLSARRACVGR